jgi:zinc D-Ala-D-Ala dipeptidase
MPCRAHLSFWQASAPGAVSYPLAPLQRGEGQGEGNPSSPRPSPPQVCGGEGEIQVARKLGCALPCIIRAFVTVCLLPLWLNAQQGPPLRETLSQSSQLVVVTTRDWTATEGLLRRFERKEHNWQQVGPSVRVVVGRSGLGWGRGLTNFPASAVPQKREGDGRSPAGVFRLTYAFGYAAVGEVPEIKLPYIQCTDQVECVDDIDSAYYNIIKDRRDAEKVDWKSSEKMRMSDDEYKLGIFIAHNISPPEPGAGSCVFMHIWKEPGHPTSGCTAMSVGAIESLLGWLDPRSNPILVQLPQEEYRQFQITWMLPAIDF